MSIGAGKNMIRIIGLILFACSLTVSAAAPRITLDPPTVVVGEPAQLKLESDGGFYPRIVSKPSIQGLDWGDSPSRSSSYQSINGKVSQKYTSIYIFQVSSAGEYTIPAMKVVSGGTSYTTKPISFKAIGSGNQQVSVNNQKAELKDLLYGKAEYTNDSKTAYVGEEIPLQLRLYVYRGMDIELSWPQMQINNALFSDFSAKNKQNRNFDQPSRPKLEEVNGKIYDVYIFNTAFRMLTPGNVKGNADITVRIKVHQRKTRRSSWDDDFFGGMSFAPRYRVMNKKVQIKLPSMTVKELPEAPKGAEFLGLVGIWDVQYSLSTDKLKVGEPVTFKIKIKGQGGLESLEAPKIDLPGFRVYPPEIKQSTSPSGNQEATISYMLFPRKPGEEKLTMNVSTFSSVREKYLTHKFERELAVAPGEEQVAGKTVYSQNNGNKSQSNGKAVEEPSIASKKPVGILHLKKKTSGPVEVPLYLNYLWWYVLLLIGGPLIWLLNELRIMRQKTLDGDESMRRRRSAQTNRSKVLKALHKATDDQLDDTVNSIVVPHLNDLMGYPPGTTATELADKVDDGELAKCLKSSGNSSYMPGAVSMDSKELRKKLIKVVKRLSIFLLLTFISFNSIAADKVKKVEPVNSNSEALTAYEGGEFKRAAAWYRNKIDQYAPDAALLYNLGNCYYQMNEMPAALLCFERARLLEPGDSDIIENLNRTREQLFQKPVGVIKDPKDLMLRVSDSLRPDQWLLVAAIGWFALCLAITFRRKYNRNKLTIMLIVTVLTIVLGLLASSQEFGSLYNDQNAIILEEGAKVYSLPSLENGKVVERLRGGDRVEMVEQRVKWALIRKNGTEGWIKADALAKIAPGGKLPPL